MRLQILFILVFVLIMFSSCEIKDSNGNQNYFSLTFKNEQINYEESITYLTGRDKYDFEEGDSSVYKCQLYGLGPTENIYLSFSFPLYTEMFNKSLIGKKHPLTSASCGPFFGNSELFNFNLTFHHNGIYYPTHESKDTSKYYNRILEYEYFGDLYGGYDGFYISGEFKVAFVDQTKFPRDTIMVEDGKYNITFGIRKLNDR